MKLYMLVIVSMLISVLFFGLASELFGLHVRVIDWIRGVFVAFVAGNVIYFLLYIIFISGIERK